MPAIATARPLIFNGPLTNISNRGKVCGWAMITSTALLFAVLGPLFGGLLMVIATPETAVVKPEAVATAFTSVL